MDTTPKVADFQPTAFYKEGSTALFNKDEWAPTWFRHALGINSNGWPSKFSNIFPNRPVAFEVDPFAAPPTAIIITNFDLLMEMNGTESMITALSDMGYRTKKFNIMLCVDSWKNAEAILQWNDRYKIRLVDCAEMGIWHKEHIEQQIPVDLSDETRDNLIQMGVAAGTPGFILIAMACNGKSDWLMEQVRQTASQWHQGIRALSYLHSEATCLPITTTLDDTYTIE